MTRNELEREIDRLRADVARLNKLLEADDHAERLANQRFEKLAHEHAQAIAERDEAHSRGRLEGLRKAAEKLSTLNACAWGGPRWVPIDRAVAAIRKLIEETENG